MQSIYTYLLFQDINIRGDTIAYDLVVIGTGTAGTNCASICKGSGMDVAIIDYRPFGGTCALRGCTPKKVLVGAASLIGHANHLRDWDLYGGDVKLRWPALMKFKRSFTDPVPDKRKNYYNRQSIDAFAGLARFQDGGTVIVGDVALESDMFLIATGSTPRTLGIPGEEHMLSSEGFMGLDELPDRILFVGGGYVSFEFAHVAALAGADVTILHKGPTPLSNFDSTIVGRLLDVSRGMGIKVELNSPVVSIERGAGEYNVRTGGGQEHTADCVVHGAGRVPEIDRLDLGVAGVANSRMGVRVNKYMQSVSNPKFYAAGDVVENTPPLKTVSEREGIVAGNNIANGNSVEMDYSAVPSVLFTMPEVASVGLSEEEAMKDGLDAEVVETDMSSWFSSKYIGMDNAYSKVIKDRASGTILGAHIMCPRAGELINLFALAKREGIPASKLKEIPWAFPTNTSDISYLV